MTTIQEQIKLLQAVADGKTLQYRVKRDANSTEWKDASADWHNKIKVGNTQFTFYVYDWRIKPEPKVIWVNEYPGNRISIPHLTESAAKQSAASDAVRVAIKYQEVL